VVYASILLFTYIYISQTWHWGDKKIGSIETEEMKLLILPRDLKGYAKVNSRCIYGRYCGCIA